MGTVRVEGLTVRFGRITAIRGLSFEVADGEFFTIIGPTNAGKTTTLRTITGLETPAEGEVFINRVPVTRVHPSERRLSLLFQNLALFPQYTGFENLAFPLRVAGIPTDEVSRRVRAMAETLRITHLLDRLPRTFSGGEQQRVAIGRAIILETEAALLDEPLSNLDARIRLSLRNELKRLQRELGRTFIYVTHDQVEAMTLSDRALVLRAGEIQQIGTPDDLYNRPRNRFVAEFIGSPPMNLIPGRIEQAGSLVFVADDGGIRCELGRLRAAVEAGTPLARAALGIRPEDVRLSVRGAGGWIRGVTRAVEPIGSKTLVEITCGGQVIRAIAPAGWEGRRQEPVWVAFDSGRIHLLDLATDRFVPERVTV